MVTLPPSSPAPTPTPTPAPTPTPTPTPRPGARRAAGGVVVHPDGQRVLLRRPTPNPGFDDLAWTHAKGGVDDETPLQAAQREVREELGVEVELLAPIPGWYDTGSTTNTYFVFRWRADVAVPDPHETAEVRWVAWDEAAAWMRRGRKQRSVARDVAVLVAARQIYDVLLFGGRPPRV